MRGFRQRPPGQRHRTGGGSEPGRQTLDDPAAIAQPGEEAVRVGIVNGNGKIADGGMERVVKMERLRIGIDIGQPMRIRRPGIGAHTELLDKGRNDEWSR